MTWRRIVASGRPFSAWGCLIIGTAGGLIGCLTGCEGTFMGPKGFVAGQDLQGPWWMQQTAMTRDGRLDLKSKPWWPRAAALKVGEQFVIEAGGVPADRMSVRREKIRNRSQEVEAIVWVIDDDGDGSIRKGGDGHSDCYVADYKADGVVDRIVDYIDNDGDKIPDEMDIRYFANGQLSYSWFGMDLDHDGKTWSVVGYEYGGPSFFEADPYGNNMIYMNKFNPNRGAWSPISECPFAFYDTDGDGQSEVVVRVSAVPLDYDRSLHPDYANNQYGMAWNKDMERMGVVNIRYSFDIDNLSSKTMPLHYDFGFNLVGATPYVFAGMEHFNAKRRPPQVTCVIPHERLRAVSDRYAARETGFSWHEQHDDTISIGYGDRKGEDWRWEGVFWTWERRFMENSGGPCQKWNVRREWSNRPSSRRELYYSGVDRRIHLAGAQEGWIQVGHFAGLDALGEIRMYDTDGNGYFDRWEVYTTDSAVPVRVSTVHDEKVRRIPFDYEWLTRFYTQEVLPAAMSANARLIAAMSRLRPFDVPPEMTEAMKAGPQSYQRYVQDIIREAQYQDLRQHLTEKAHGVLSEAKMDDLRPLNAEQRRTTWNSETAWQVIRTLERLDVAYGEGDFDRASGIVDDLTVMARDELRTGI